MKHWLQLRWGCCELDSFARAFELRPVRIPQTFHALITKLFKTRCQVRKRRLHSCLTACVNEFQQRRKLFAELNRLPIAHVRVIEQLGPFEFRIKHCCQADCCLLQTVGEDVVSAKQLASDYLTRPFLSGPWFEHPLQVVPNCEDNSIKRVAQLLVK